MTGFGFALVIHHFVVAAEREETGPVFKADRVLKEVATGGEFFGQAEHPITENGREEGLERGPQEMIVVGLGLLHTRCNELPVEWREIDNRSKINGERKRVDRHFAYVMLTRGVILNYHATVTLTEVMPKRSGGLPPYPITKPCWLPPTGLFFALSIHARMKHCMHLCRSIHVYAYHATRIHVNFCKR